MKKKVALIFSTLFLLNSIVCSIASADGSHNITAGASGDNYSIKLEGNTTAPEGILILAQYDKEDSNKLIKADLYNLSNGQYPNGNDFSDNITLKAMWWNGLNEITPYCDGVATDITDSTNVDGMWYASQGKTYYYKNNAAVTGWTDKIPEYRGSWLFFDQSTGAMATGWKNDIPGYPGKWFYFNPNTGVMASGWTTGIPGYDGQWFYFNPSSGVMTIGWFQEGGKRYYFDKNGIMQTGWAIISGKWYYFNPSGIMQTGWIKNNEKWYYFNSDGVMQTGWVQVDGTWYYLDENGVWIENAVKED